MPIDIKVNISLTPRQQRIVRLAVVSGAVLGALGIGVAVAAPKHTFTAGQPLSAAQLNENFEELHARMQVVESGRAATNIGGVPYSIGATKVIGGTATNYNGAEIEGYKGAKKKCEAQFTPTAHMCTTEEVARSAQAGVTFPVSFAWYMTATRTGRDANAAGVVNDCFGWTVSGTGSSNAYASAAYIQGNAVSFTLLTCDQQAAILCCD